MNEDNFHLTEEQIEFQKNRKKANKDVLKSFALVYGSAILIGLGPHVLGSMVNLHNNFGIFLEALVTFSVVPLGVGFVKFIKKCAKAFYYNVNNKDMMNTDKTDEMNKKNM